MLILLVGFRCDGLRDFEAGKYVKRRLLRILTVRPEDENRQTVRRV